MARGMKSVRLTARSKMLHAEAPGCIVNITVGLSDRGGHRVTSIEILADGGRYSGETPWWVEGLKGSDCRNFRVIEGETKITEEES